MELLERYLNQIKKHLPLKDRQDTLDELRSLLLEEFDSKANGVNDEEILYEIIKNNGYPIEVAARYRNNEPLISSTVRPYFFMGIKIVSAVIPFALLLATLIGFISNKDSFKVMDLLLELAYTIPSIINALIFGYGIVFIIFILMNRYALEEFKKEIPSFEPKTLPKVPTKVYKISIFEHVIEILGIVFLLYLLNYTEGLIALSVDGIKVQLLNNNFNDILPFLNISLFMSLAVSIIQLSKRSKTKFTVTLDYVKTIYTGIIMITLAQNDIFTESVITEYGINFLPSLIRILLYIGAIASFFAGTISYIITMNKMKSNFKYKI